MVSRPSTASHFKAAKMKLEEQFPRALIQGLFLARVVRPPASQEDFQLFSVRRARGRVEWKRSTR